MTLKTFENADLALRSVKYILTSNEEKVEKALAGMQQDPTYHLEWSFACLAVSSFSKRMLDGIQRLEENGSNPEGVVAAVVRECMSIVFRGTLMNSTSQSANAIGIEQLLFAQRILDAIGVNKYGIEEAILPKRAE